MNNNLKFLENAEIVPRIAYLYTKQTNLSKTAQAAKQQFQNNRKSLDEIVKCIHI